MGKREWEFDRGWQWNAFGVELTLHWYAKEMSLWFRLGWFWCYLGYGEVPPRPDFLGADRANDMIEPYRSVYGGAADGN